LTVIFGVSGLFAELVSLAPDDVSADDVGTSAECAELERAIQHRQAAASPGTGDIENPCHMMRYDHGRNRPDNTDGIDGSG